MSLDAMRWAWTQDIPSSRKCLLLALADCHNASDGRCIPSVAFLMKKMGKGITRNGVQKGIKWLEESGLVNRVAAKGDDGRQKANSFILHTNVFITDDEPKLKEELMEEGGAYSGIPLDEGHTPVYGGGILQYTLGGIPQYAGGHTSVCPGNPKGTQRGNPKENPNAPESTEGYIHKNGVHPEPAINGTSTNGAKPAKAAKPAAEYPYPDWWEPLTHLNGYVHMKNPDKTVKTIISACDAVNVEPIEVVREFADYYTKGGQQKHAWRNPVSALRTTIQIQVNKMVQKQVKNGTVNPPTVSDEFREKMRQEFGEQFSGSNDSVDNMIDDALNQRRVLYVLSVEDEVKRHLRWKAGFANNQRGSRSRPKIITDPNQYDFFAGVK